MPPEGLSYEEAIRILSELHELSEQHRIIVIGGQAVALWYPQLSAMGYLSGEELAPLTSKDIDFRAARQTVGRAAALLGGEARLPTIDDQDEVPAVVIHPQRLMESRVHNIVGLKQDSAHALRQARAAIACAGAFSRLILDSDQPADADRVRAVLKLNERTYRFCRQPVAREFVRKTGIDQISQTG